MDEVFATPRVASGALFVDAERFLLVRPTYKETWDLPGGYVDQGESPYAACLREVREELGFIPRLERLLAVDWAPSERDGDKLLFIFLADPNSFDASAVVLEPVELAEWRFVTVEEAAPLLDERLRPRLASAMSAALAGRTVYMDRGAVRAGL